MAKDRGPLLAPEMAQMLNALIQQLPSMLVAKCPECKGEGEVWSDEWQVWWNGHEKDWKTAEKPSTDEYEVCPNCNGKKRVPTRLGLALVEAIDLTREIRG